MADSHKVRWVDNVRGNRRFGHAYDPVRGKTLCGRRIQLGHPWHDCGLLNGDQVDCKTCERIEHYTDPITANPAARAQSFFAETLAFMQDLGYNTYALAQ